MKIKQISLKKAFLLPFIPLSLNAAQAPSLKINGFTIMTASSVKQQRQDNGKGGTPTHIGIGASDLYFTMSGRSQSGVEYKYRVNIEASPSASTTINKNYVEFNGNFGTIQAGMFKGPEDTFRMDSLSIAGGANAIDGSLTNVYNMSAGVISGVNMIGYTNKAAKVAMYSPTVSGFQLGVAYTPNTSYWGGDTKNNAKINNYLGVGNSTAIYPDKNKQPFGKNNVSLGLKYLDNFGKWTYGASIIGIRESSTLTVPDSQGRLRVRNANSYAVNAQVGYDVFKIVGGYFDNRKSRLPKDTLDNTVFYTGNAHQGNAGSAYNFGGQWIHGAYELAVSYYDTQRKTDATSKAKSNIIVTSLDYAALQGLKFFTEVDFISSKTNDKAVAMQQAYLDDKSKGSKAVAKNSGTVFVLGTKLSF